MSKSSPQAALSPGEITDASLGGGSGSNPFGLKDCALATIATGRQAQNLHEMREILTDIPAGCLYYHFCGALLRPRFVEREFNNDFAVWAFQALHDQPLAERLSVIDPDEYPDLEVLRREVIETIEERLDQLEYGLWARGDQRFQFLRSQIAVFDTGRRVQSPEELVTILPTLSLGSIFYHFIDARRRTDGGVDDFRAWLTGWGDTYGPLQTELASTDPYFPSLAELRDELTRLFQLHTGGTCS